MSEPVPAHALFEKERSATTIIVLLLLVEGAFLLACLLYV